MKLLKLLLTSDRIVIGCTVQKMKFSIKDILKKCDQIRSFLRIWSYLLKKSFMENFIFCPVIVTATSLTKNKKNQNQPVEDVLQNSISATALI